MNLLETIGIVTILVLIYLIVKHFYEKHLLKCAKFSEKARILIDHHEEMNTYFEDFLYKENQMISYSYNKNQNDENYFDNGHRGGKKEIFGRNYKIYNLNTDIEKSISNKIIELEKDDYNRVIIQQVIENTKKQYQAKLKLLEINLFETNALFLKYGYVLDIIFPNTNVKLTQGEIIQKLSFNLDISDTNAEMIFIELTKKESQFINEYFINLLSPTTGKYFYSLKMLKEKMKKLENEIDYFTLKYH